MDEIKKYALPVIKSIGKTPDPKVIKKILEDERVRQFAEGFMTSPDQIDQSKFNTDGGYTFGHLAGAAIPAAGVAGGVKTVGKKVATNLDDAAKVAKGAEKVVSDLPPITPYEGAKDLTTKVLDKLKGATMVHPQTIQNLTKMPDVKQAERDLITKKLEKYLPAQGKLPASQFAKEVEEDLLPLSMTNEDSYTLGPEDFYPVHHENTVLPNELRGNVAKYRENIYESPIATSADNAHFPEQAPGYFAHSRVEDLDDNASRRVIEIQSDLFQKGNLGRENEVPEGIVFEGFDEGGAMKKTINPDKKALYDARQAEVDKLKPYENTWHERVIREEVKKAAQDGKTKLQFPVGDTAMKIEGLGQQQNNWSHVNTEADDWMSTLTPDKLKVGGTIADATSNRWVVTDVLGDGKFKAIPQRNSDFQILPDDKGFIARNSVGETITGLKSKQEAQEAIKNQLERYAEEFDISGKVDQNNPIYKFYESEVGKYLGKKYNAKRIKDPQGVEWWEVDVKPEVANQPVEAFAAAPMLMQQYGQEENQDPMGKYQLPPIK